VAGRHIVMLEGRHTVLAERRQGVWVLTPDGETLAQELFGGG
jgi:hypothetical protein